MRDSAGLRGRLPALTSLASVSHGRIIQSRATRTLTPPRCIIEVSLVSPAELARSVVRPAEGDKIHKRGSMLSRSLNVCVTLCLWITALKSPESVCARKQDDSFFTASIYQARCASRCLSLHITRISAFFKHSQVRACGRTNPQRPPAAQIIMETIIPKRGVVFVLFFFSK